MTLARCIQFLKMACLCVAAMTMMILFGSSAHAQSFSPGSDSVPENICKGLQQARLDQNLPNGYRPPQPSLLEMNSKERAAGMLCKVSFTFEGSGFSAIRYRVFRNPEAAEKGFRSMGELSPEITVFKNVGIDKWEYGDLAPASCMVYTAGDRKLTFVSCAARVDIDSVVFSGISSQPASGSSYDVHTLAEAMDLLTAALEYYVPRYGFDVGLHGIFDEVEKNHKK